MRELPTRHVLELRGCRNVTGDADPHLMSPGAGNDAGWSTPTGVIRALCKASMLPCQWVLVVKCGRNCACQSDLKGPLHLSSPRRSFTLSAKPSVYLAPRKRATIVWLILYPPWRLFQQRKHTSRWYDNDLVTRSSSLKIALTVALYR